MGKKQHSNILLFIQLYPWLYEQLRSIHSVDDIIYNIVQVITWFNTLQYQTSVPSKFPYCVYSPRMKRIFIASESQTQSFSIPFSCTSNSSTRFLHARVNNNDIDSKACAIIISFLETQGGFDRINQVINEIVREDFDCSDREYIDLAIAVIETILRNDASYFRQDHDESHKHERTIHPLNHLDIFYSNISSVKIGVEEYLPVDKLHDVIDNTSNAYFLKEIF